MRKLITLLAVLTLAAPLMFYGCTGDDGSTGAAGAAGAPGSPGPPGPPGPGAVSNESCVVCHGTGDLAVDPVHRIGASPGSVTFTITSVVYGAPAGDNVPVTVNFTFAAKNSAGTTITNQIDLRLTGGNNFGSATDNLSYMRVSLAKLVAGTNGDSDQYSAFVPRFGVPGVTGSGPYYTSASNGNTGAVFTYDNVTGAGSYRLPDNAVRVSDGYVDNVPIRVGIQVSGLPVALFTSDPFLQTSLKRPVANAIFDSVPNGAAVTVFKNDVSTASATQSCNKCHDPLGLHGGSRREYKFCQVCHNSKIETVAGGSFDNGNLINLVHGIHNGKNIGELGNFTEVVFPQAINNCTTCHAGPAAADNTYSNWRNKPTAQSCGSCHTSVNFVTGTGHLGGAQPNNSQCATCHNSSAIPIYHASREGAPPTPNNLVRPNSTLAVFEYGIDSVTVDNTNAATVKFWIKKDGAYVNFLPSAGDNVAKVPAGFSGSPSFLVAHGGTASNTKDYSNFDEIPTGGFGASFATAQPKSVTIVGLPVTTTDNQVFTAKLTGANTFPAGAKMRAVALQGYFTQINGGTVTGVVPVVQLDNVGRHTPAVMKAVTGDTGRRVIVKSGYDNVAGVMTPVGCLECHEVFEGHGGNRVNNVQVCVMCHNPNMTTSGRTIPDNVTKNTELVAKYPGSSLTYPEVAQNMAEMIHGIHAKEMRVNSYDIIRNRQETANVYGVVIFGTEITPYPGDLSDCRKCHLAGTYGPNLPDGVSFTTEKVTTGNASETLDNIIAARKSFPNATDLVDSPVVGKCGYCHDAPATVGHFISNGGDVKQTRSIAELAPPKLAPEVLAAP